MSGSSSMTILELLKLTKPKIYKSGHGETKGLPSPDLLVGLELEMENFPGWTEQEFGGIRFTEDGSLRNFGCEAITAPIALNQMPNFLTAFYERMEVTDKNYSERCSTHVHANVQDMTTEQVSTLALLYQTAERLLFQFIGHDRQNNIFCVPWYQSGLTASIVDKLAQDAYITTRHWQKYSALNLIPIGSQGTVEFRHLYGTCDVKFITNWLCLIGRLFEYAKSVPLAEARERIINMNTVSNYREWLYSVFGSDADLLTVPSDFEVQLSKGVVDSKVMLTKYTYPTWSSYKAPIGLRDAAPTPRGENPLDFLDDILAEEALEDRDLPQEERLFAVTDGEANMQQNNQARLDTVAAQWDPRARAPFNIDWNDPWQRPAPVATVGVGAQGAGTAVQRGIPGARPANPRPRRILGAR